MAIVEYTSGANTINTIEWSCVSNAAGPAANTTDGTYWITLDLSTLVANDVFELRMYEKVRSADTQRLVATSVFAGPQGDPIYVSVPIPFLHGWDYTLIRTSNNSATGKTITWSIRKYD